MNTFVHIWPWQPRSWRMPALRETGPLSAPAKSKLEEPLRIHSEWLYPVRCINIFGDVVAFPSWCFGCDLKAPAKGCFSVGLLGLGMERPVPNEAWKTPSKEGLIDACSSGLWCQSVGIYLVPVVWNCTGSGASCWKQAPHMSRNVYEEGFRWVFNEGWTNHGRSQVCAVANWVADQTQYPGIPPRSRGFEWVQCILCQINQRYDAIKTPGYFSKTLRVEVEQGPLSDCRRRVVHVGASVS